MQLWLDRPPFGRTSTTETYNSLPPFKNGNSPLHTAVGTGGCEVIKMLLQHGANVNAKNHYTLSPLTMAVSRGSPGVVELLLANNARIDLVDVSHYLNIPLHRAICLGGGPLSWTYYSTPGPMSISGTTGAEPRFTALLGEGPIQ
jgi:ankyrin repeat protein